MGTWPGGRTFPWRGVAWVPLRWSAEGSDGGSQGSRPDWAEVVTRYADTIYTMAYRLTGSDEEARDLAQDVLLRLHRSLDRYREGNFEGWLYRTTLNVFRDRLRKRKRRREDVTEELPQAVSLESVERESDLGELRQTIQRALMQLTPEYREAIVMRDLEGRSYEEISQILDIPAGTVRSRIHRGREALRELLGPYVEADK